MDKFEGFFFLSLKNKMKTTFSVHKIYKSQIRLWKITPWSN